MALSFGNSVGTAPAGVSVQTGADLEDIQTEVCVVGYSESQRQHVNFWL